MPTLRCPDAEGLLLPRAPPVTSITSAEVRRGAGHLYCFKNLPFTPKAITADPQSWLDGPRLDIFDRSELDVWGPEGCGIDMQYAIRLADGSGNENIDFSVHFDY